MTVYKSIIQGLTEAVDYQQGKIPARKARLTIKPVITFNPDDIKRIRQKTGLSQVVFAGVAPSLSGSRIHIEYPIKCRRK